MISGGVKAIQEERVSQRVSVTGNTVAIGASGFLVKY